MEILKISDNYRIRAHDELNFVVEEYREVKNRDNTRMDWCFNGYYPDLEWLEKSVKVWKRCKGRAFENERQRANLILDALSSVDAQEEEKRLKSSLTKRVVTDAQIEKMQAGRRKDN